MGLSMMYWGQLDKMEREMIVERTGDAANLLI